jgi:aspartate/methionine/tyrosine aminotransferase
MTIFRKKISSKVKAVIINFPSNPTGTIIPLDDLEEIARLLKRNNAYAISDEIYSQIMYIDTPFQSIYSLPGMKERTILVDGFSKTYSMTGWRLGYLVAPTSIMERINLFLTHSVACTATFTQIAGLRAITGSQKPVEKMVKEFKRRRDFVVDELNAIKGVSCTIPGGAFYAFPNITSFNKSSKFIADYLLEDAGVALLDGTAFGKFGEGYLRISYATDMETLSEGLQKMKRSLDKLL